MPTFNNAMLSGFELYPRWVPLIKPPKTSLDLSQRLLVISIQCPFDTGCFENFCTVGL